MKHPKDFAFFVSDLIKSVQELHGKLEEAAAGWKRDRRTAELAIADSAVDAEAKLSALTNDLDKAKQRILELESNGSSSSHSSLSGRAPLMLTDGSQGTQQSICEILGALQDKDALYRAEQAERKRLEMNLDFILKEIEHKAPILENQRRDYKRAISTHNM